jgi:hypothetical protein
MLNGSSRSTVGPEALTTRRDIPLIRRPVPPRLQTVSSESSSVSGLANVTTNKMASMVADFVNSTSSSAGEQALPSTWSFNLAHLEGALRLPSYFAGWSTWQYVTTALLGVIIYDQGKSQV